MTIETPDYRKLAQIALDEAEYALKINPANQIFHRKMWPPDHISGHEHLSPIISFLDHQPPVMVDEFFAKWLLNSSISFCTLEDSSVDGGGTPEIHLAAHPHYGALVCDALFLEPGERFERECIYRAETLREAHTLLVEFFNEQVYDAKDFHQCLDETALFMVLLNAQPEDLPDHPAFDGIHIIGPDDLDQLPAHMIRAMRQHTDKPENPDDPPEHFRDRGGRFLATLESFNPLYIAHYSSLHILKNHDLL